MDEPNKAVASDKAEGTIVRGSAGQSAGVATTGPSPTPSPGYPPAPPTGPTSLPEDSAAPTAEGKVYESAEQEEGDPNAQREALGPEEEPAPAISMTNPPPREPPSLSGAKVSASRLYMLLHNATNRASMDEGALRSAWDDLKHHMGGVV